MQAIIFNQPGIWTETLQLIDTEIAEPGDDEVQIKICARPINPSDEMFIQGVYRWKPSFPQIAGVEGASIIENVGRQVDRSLIGEHVAFRARGTWCDKINLKRNEFRIIPRELPFEIGCQLSLNTLTAYALLEYSNLSPDEWLLVTAGNSSVSKQIIQLAKTKKIRVIAIVRNEQHKNTLLNIGADVVLNSEADNIEKAVMAVTKNGANTILDAVGGSLGTTMFSVAAPFGRIIIYGRLSNDDTRFSYGTVIYKNLKIEGFGIDRWLRETDKNKVSSIWCELTTAVVNKTLHIDFDKVFPLKDFKDAIVYYSNTKKRTILK